MDRIVEKLIKWCR